jgi:uracil permease
VILFGMIASVGIRTLAEAKIDYSVSRNLIIVALMLVLGLAGVSVNLSETFQISGMALAAIIGIVLNKAIPAR